MAFSLSLFLVTAAIAFGNVAAAADEVAFYCYANGDNTTPKKVASGDTTDTYKSVVLDPSKPTALVVHGWMARYNKPNPQQMKDTLVQKGYQVCLADFPSNLNYIKLLSDFKPFATKFSAMWKSIVDYNNIDLNNVICIGHSYGAHMCGGITPKGRILYGCDPAGPGFNAGNENSLKLNSTTFVATYITSSASTPEPNGCANYIINKGGIQPVCPSNGGVDCDHASCWSYLGDAFSKKFSTSKCSSTAEARELEACSPSELMDITAEQKCGYYAVTTT